jgi:hypothetical protein
MTNLWSPGYRDGKEEAPHGPPRRIEEADDEANKDSPNERNLEWNLIQHGYFVKAFLMRLEFQKRSALKFVSRIIQQSRGNETQV